MRLRRPRRPRVPVLREKHEQAAGVTLLKSLRCAVYVSGTARREGDYQGTNQTPGISDVLGCLPDLRGILFWEAKSRRGRPSPEQDAFRTIIRAYEAAGLPIYHCLGTYDALIAKLITIGMLRGQDVPHYRLPDSTI